MADRAARRGADHAVVTSDVAAHGAHGGALEAALGVDGAGEECRRGDSSNAKGGFEIMGGPDQ